MKPLIDQLTDYRPKDSKEWVYRQQMIDFLHACEDHAFERSCAMGHFTASALILNPERTKILLMHHKKLKRWVQPGGHCDGESDCLTVALKEAAEETGIDHFVVLNNGCIFDIDIHLIPKNSKDNAHYHFDVRFLLQASTEVFHKNKESLALNWFDVSADHGPLQEGTIPESIGRMISKVTAMSL